MKLNEESSDFVYLGKRIDKALDYIQNSKTDLLDWFKQYVEIPYQDIMSGELNLEEEDYTFDYLDSLLDDLEKKFNIIFKTKNKMNKETLRMQILSGVITESEYKAKLEEFDMDQFSFGNSSSPKASFEDKWNDVPNANKEILKKSTGKEPVKIMASSKGANYVITKGSDGKFYRYQYTQAENPGKPMGPFSSEEEAKKLNESLNEHYVAGGIVGVGAINNPFEGRKKEVYENAFEYFLGKKYSLNEMEDDMPEAPSHEETDAAQVYEESVEEGNLGHNEIASLTPEGRFWIVSWRGMDGPKEKVFTDEDEARAFMNTLEEGKEVEEPNNY